MKAKLIRPLMKENPAYKPEAAKVASRSGQDYPVKQYLPAPKGTLIDHRDAWKLVANGDAEPADGECLARIQSYFAKRGQSYEDGLGEAIKQRDRLDKGIDPRHFPAYDEGRMDGYDKRGRTTLAGELVELEEDQPQDQFVIVLDANQEPNAEAA